jgi:ParB-like chromosome segregation protein Spo0J
MENIEHWPIDKFIEYVRNPRKNDHAVDRIASAIKEFGFKVPIIAKSDGSIVDGHLRLKAARKLKLDTLPVLIADDLTDAQIKAFRLSINKMAEIAEWDEELLALELEELQVLDFDLGLIGFDEDELADILRIAEEVSFPILADGDKDTYHQMTFTLHDDQAEQVKMAIEGAKDVGAFIDTENENSNGNALARICETYNGIS